MNKNKTIRIALGVFLLIGAIIGGFKACTSLLNHMGGSNLVLAGIQLIFVLLFVYIATVGLKLIQDKSNAAQQAKWIFLLQVPIVSIQGALYWALSTGVAVRVIYSLKHGFFTDVSILFQHAGGYFYFLPTETGIGINVAALALAWLAHYIAKLTTQLPNETLKARTDEDYYVQAYQELQTKTQDIATWAKALASSNGDNDVAEATYLRTRVEALQQSNTANYMQTLHQTSTTSQAQPQTRWSLKKKLAAGIGAVMIASLIVLFGSGTLKLNFDGKHSGSEEPVSVSMNNRSTEPQIPES